MNFKTLASTALVAGLLAGGAQAADLKIALQDDPDVLDPAQSRSFVGRIVYAAMCDALVDIDADVNFVPKLATDWKFSDDGLKLVMNLRQGVKFQDGEDFNADAVVYTINRNMTMKESRRKSDLASVDKIEKTGDYQVTFTLKQPDASLVAQLYDRAGMIVAPKAAEAEGANFGAHPVCAGPFKFVERVPQDRIVLEKFDGYWNAKDIHFDKVTYLPIPDTTVRLANLQSGDVDLVDRIASTDADTVKANPKLGYAEVAGLGNMGIYFNLANGTGAKNPMGENKLLRQAFSLSIDRDAIDEVVFNGAALPGNQPWPPTSVWYDKTHPVPPRDIDKARALVKEAGFDRVKVTIKHANNPVVTQAMQMIQAMAAEAGFDVTLQSTEFATLLDDQSSGNFEVSRSDWSGRPDPDGNVYQFFTTKGGLNDPKYSNPEVDRLLNEARASTDPAVRKAKYDAFVGHLLEDNPIVYLGTQKYLYGFTAKLNGFKPLPDAMIRLQGVSKAD